MTINMNLDSFMSFEKLVVGGGGGGGCTWIITSALGPALVRS